MRHLLQAVLGIVGLCLPFLSCSSSEQAASGCKTEADCKTDELCVSKKCVKMTPDSGADAPEDSGGQVCQGKTTSPTAGRNCGCSADCDSPETCLDEASSGVPGGMCVRSCSGGACPSDLLCLQSTPGAPGTEGCFIGCTQSGDCPTGQICDTLETGGKFICTAFCQSDQDCPVIGKCDRYTGICALTAFNPNGKDTGEPCAKDSECKSDFCIAGIALFPDGYCTAFCSIEKQGCPDGSACMPIWGDADKGLCLKTCSSVADCRTGYGCVSNSKVPGVKVCGPS